MCVSALPLDLKILSGKCGRSESAASGFFVQLCLELVCNEDMLAFAGNDLREFSLTVSFGLETCVGGKYG